jgi:hypothetical protein
MSSRRIGDRGNDRGGNDRGNDRGSIKSAPNNRYDSGSGSDSGGDEPAPRKAETRRNGRADTSTSSAPKSSASATASKSASASAPASTRSNKSKPQTQLIDFVRKIDPEMYEVIVERLCMGGALRVGRNIAGITFLRPTDVPTRKRIFDLANSDNVDDMIESTQLINAMIITMNLPSHRDFHNARGELVNRLGQKMEVITATSSKIEFVGGGVAVINREFALACRGNASTATTVYSLYDMTGEIPTNGEKIARVRKTRRTRRGGDTEDETTISARAIASTLEERKHILATTAGEYHEVLINKMKALRNTVSKSTSSVAPKSPDYRMRDPYVFKSLSLLMFAKRKYPELYLTLLARTSLEKSDLYLYLQGHGDNFLVPPDILSEWNRGEIDLSGMTVAEASRAVVADINDVLYGSKSHRVNALECVDDVRDENRNNFINYDHLKDMYMDLIKYLPEKVASKYTIEQKIYEDDFRMTTWALFVEVENAAFDEGMNPLHTLEDTVTKLMEASRGSYESRMCVVNGGTHTTKDIPAFVNSVYFMYIPSFDILDDLDLIPVDELSDDLEEDSIFAGNINGIEDIVEIMGDEILGANLSSKQVISAIDILLARRRANTLSKEEEWKLNELIGV